MRRSEWEASAAGPTALGRTIEPSMTQGIKAAYR